MLNLWSILYNLSLIWREKLKREKILIGTLKSILFNIWRIQRFLSPIISIDLVIDHITRDHSLSASFHFVVILQAFWISIVMIVVIVESKILSMSSITLRVQILIISSLKIVSVDCLISGFYDSSMLWWIDVSYLYEEYLAAVVGSISMLDVLICIDMS